MLSSAFCDLNSFLCFNFSSLSLLFRTSRWSLSPTNFKTFLWALRSWVWDFLILLGKVEGLGWCCLPSSMVLLVEQAESTSALLVLCRHSDEFEREDWGELSHSCWMSWSLGATAFWYSMIPESDHFTFVLLFSIVGAVMLPNEGGTAWGLNGRWLDISNKRTASGRVAGHIS